MNETLNPRPLTYEEDEREAIQLEAWAASRDPDAAARQDARHWRAGRSQGALARTSPLRAEQARKAATP